MKKLLLVLGAVTLASNCVFAEIDSSETSSLSNIKKQGYSESMVRVMDTVKSKNQSNANYVREYTPPKRTKLQNAYHHIKLYLDPSQDDGKFGEHEVNFSNNWLGDDTHYASPLNKKEDIENL